ncbi:MAG: RsmE family RNA methyltransferase [Planctomycetaceae bacterium]
MANRFYVPGNWQPGDLVPLPQPEAQHALRVLRLASGEQIEVFDGAGRAAQAELQVESSRKASVEITDSLITEPPSQPSISVALAPPKGDRFRWIVEKLTELGVDRIIPMKTARSVVDPRDSKLAKLEQATIAACKQCGRNRLPELDGVIPFAELLAAKGTSQLVYGDPQGVSISKLSHTSADNAEFLILIGPEGGFTDEEIDLLSQHNAQGVRIGRHVLRIETAAVSLAAALMSHL